ncbi:MAG: PEP-CTERM sorting domain-containing protein [Armatimonas sp.]
MRLFSKSSVLCALMLAFLPLCAQAQILVTSFGPGQVLQYTNNGTLVGQFASVNTAHNITFDATGNAYISDHFDGTVNRYNPDGSNGAFFTGPGTNRGATGMVFDSLGRFYLSDFSGGVIRRYNADGSGGTIFASGLSSPDHMTIHNGLLYVANFGNRAISSFQLDGTPVSSFDTGIDNPVGLDFDSTGRLYVTGFGSGTILRYSADLLSSTTIISGLNMPHGITVGADNKLYIAESGGAGRILQSDLDGSNLATFINVANPIDVKFGSVITTSAPEPGTLTLFALGAISLAFARVRAARKAPLPGG